MAAAVRTTDVPGAVQLVVPGRCAWVATKLRWQLTADDREFEALKVYAEGPCEDTIVRYAPVV